MLHISKEPSASICRQSIHHDIGPVAFQFSFRDSLGLGDSSGV